MSIYNLNHNVDVVTNYRALSGKFNPYAMNGGSVIAIAGDDFAVIGTDTRLSLDFTIISRNQNKLCKLSDQAVLGVSGCWGDAITLTKMLKVRMHMYKYEHQKTMPTPALAQMLSTMLYYKRFFPYYVMNVLAGLDDDGRGCVFSYDPVGHCERSTYKAGGNAGSLLQPLLDNQISMLNMQNVSPTPITMDKALSLLKDGFTSAAERDMYTGDNVSIMTMDATGVKEEKFALRKD